MGQNESFLDCPLLGGLQPSLEEGERVGLGVDAVLFLVSRT